MAADPPHVFDDALLAIGDREPVDILRLRRARPAADVPEPLGAELGRLEALSEQVAHILVREELGGLN